MNKMKQSVYLFIAGVVLGFSVPAHAAGIPDTYGFGVRAMSFAGAFTAVADDYSAAYYNPAGLGQIKDHQTVIDYVYASPRFEVKKLDGEDLIIYDSEGQVRNNPVKAEGRSGGDMDLKLPEIGLVLNANKMVKIIPFNTSIGLAVSAPESMDCVFRIHDYNPDQPQFIRYGDQMDRLQVTASAGVELLPALLYVGGGFDAITAGYGKVYADNFELTSSDPRVNEEGGLSGRFEYNPLAGILITPLGKLRLGFTWRDVNYLNIPALTTNASATAGGIPATSLVMMMSVYQFYNPEEYSAGVGIDLGKILISIEADKQIWSDYEYTPNHTPYYEGSPDFKDTINKRVGVELKPNENTSLILGFAMIPTPVPDQSYRDSNYLDMDKKIFALGLSKKMNTTFSKFPIKIAGVFQYHRCDDYTVYKDGQDYAGGSADPNNLSDRTQPSYTVDGDVYAGGVSATISF